MAPDERHDMTEKAITKKRTLVRRQITMAINTARGYIRDPEMENYETSLKGISTLLKSKLNTLEDLDFQIIASCEDENMDKETIEATDYEMNVHLFSAEIEDALEKLRLPIPLLEPSQH